MIIFLIFGLILGALAVIFALQNIVPITVTFLFWQINGSLALILLMAVLMGVLVCGLLSIPEMMRTSTRFKLHKSEKRELEQSLELHKLKVSEAEAKLAHAEAEKQVAQAQQIL
ncbi:MAG: hypothetical protein RJB39_440 [Candidatus Parcubacteria bacterium]|jgi:uncharacterized integral membrane protein